MVYDSITDHTVLTRARARSLSRMRVSILMQVFDEETG